MDITKKNGRRIHKDRNSKNFDRSRKNWETDVQPWPNTEKPTPKHITFEVVLESLKCSKIDWPREMLEKITQRFDRMPRNVWSKSLMIYNGKFSEDLSLESFKKLSKGQKANFNGLKKIKPNDEKNLQDTWSFIVCQEKFMEIRKMVDKQKIEEFTRTNKTPREKVDFTLLNHIN